jgi:hypothetical protein
VYFVTLSKEQRDTLNLGGWGSPIGRAYLAAREGDYATAEARALLKVAAILVRPDAETVWRDLQNVDASWKDRADLSCETAFPRSMDLGDVIHWQDGRAEVCAAVGFKPAALAFTETGGVTEGKRS